MFEIKNFRKEYLRNSIFSSTFITLLLTATFALITVFLSLTKYDSQNTLVETLRKNQQYVVGLSKYVDEPREIYIHGEKTIEHGPIIDWYNNKFEDIQKLKSENLQADFYPSYFFNKNIQDFSDKLIFTSDKKFQYYAFGFRELVTVEDFSKFNQPLLFGRLPEQDDEVLIYDYMASSLIENGVFQGEISQIVGKTLVDRQTGFSMKISGILKSDYLRYSYIQESKGDYSFEESYLSGLQVVFGKENLIDKLQQEKLIESVFNFYFYNVTTEKQVATDIKKIKRTDLSGINFIACAENFENESGLIISKQTCADILGISVDKVDSEVAKSFLDNYFSHFSSYISDCSIERSYLLLCEFSIGAVSDNLTDQSGVCLFYDSNNSEKLWCNSAFRQIYLSLSEDWDKNVQILDNFIMQQQSEEFYKENPNYRFEGYTDYTPTGIIVHDADYYLKDVRGLADIVLMVLSISAVVGIFLFVFLSIKKYSYKIGILKSLGAKNIDISFVFGLQLLLVVVISLALSVPLAYLLMAFINGKFVNRINSSLVFFFIKPTSFLTVSLISFIVVITSLLIPLIKLALSSPISIIRNNKNR